MTVDDRNHSEKIPQSIGELIKIFFDSSADDFALIKDVLCSEKLTESYYQAIGSVQAAINYKVGRDSMDDIIGRGAVLFFAFHRIALMPEDQRDFKSLNDLAADDDFLLFLIRFHKIPGTLIARILEFHELGTTSFIFKVQTVHAGAPCALKVIQAPYVRILSIRSATRDYKHLNRLLNPKYSPEIFISEDTWILMQFLEGLNLAQFMMKLRISTPFLSEAYVSTIMAVFNLITEALSYYENKKPQVVHGDLTPYNIIVEGSITVPIGIKLFDFGPNYVLQEHVGTRPVFADVFARTELFIAPEILRGQEASIESDIYSVGMIGLELLSPEALRKDAIAAWLQKIWKDPLRMGLAQVIEDVIDNAPENRLLVIRREPAIGIYECINKFLQEQASLYREFRRSTDEAGRFKPDVAKAVENIERIRRISTAWGNQITRMQLYLSQLNVLCLYVIVFSFGLYTFADFKAAFFPQMDVLYFDKKWLEIAAMLPHDFEIGRVWKNLPGRCVALTFGLVAARYYANIFSTIHVTVLNYPLERLANFMLRINAVSYLIPILLAIVWNPHWWPWCAAVGTLFPALNNLVCWLSIRDATQKAEGVFSTSYSAHTEDFILRYFEWSVQMFLYSALIFIIGVLLHFGLAQDDAVYGYFVSAINYFKLYRNSCGSEAPVVFGNLSRVFFIARRLVARAKS